MKLRILGRIGECALLAILLCVTSENLLAQGVNGLFENDINQASAEIHWRGEPLSYSTLYALALTGMSWQAAWGNQKTFWMGWKICKGETAKELHSRQSEAILKQIQEMETAGNYSGAMTEAQRSFEFGAITCNPILKEAVGFGYLQAGEPERAYPVLASPYQASRAKGREAIYNLEEEDWRLREGAFQAAKRAGLKKDAVAFALSLVMQPKISRPSPDQEALQYLHSAGVDLQRLCLGILEAPSKLPGLPNYYYAAADLLCVRALPNDLPALMGLAESGDSYLRARAIVGLGSLAYHGAGSDGEWTHSFLKRTPTEHGLSADQMAEIEQLALQAVKNGDYRLRISGALALGLIGGDQNRVTLQRMEHDRAYVLLPRRSDGLQTIWFPVREAVAASLQRWKVNMSPGGGEMTARALSKARRGGEDVTRDMGGVDRNQVSALATLPFDWPPKLTPRIY